MNNMKKTIWKIWYVHRYWILAKFFSVIAKLLKLLILQIQKIKQTTTEEIRFFILLFILSIFFGLWMYILHVVKN